MEQGQLGRSLQVWRRGESICCCPTHGLRKPPGDLGLILCTSKLEALHRSLCLYGPRAISEGLGPQSEPHPCLNPIST